MRGVGRHAAGDAASFPLGDLTARGVERLDSVTLPNESRPTYRVVFSPSAKSLYLPSTSHSTHRAVIQRVTLPTETKSPYPPSSRDQVALPSE